MSKLITVSEDEWDKLQAVYEAGLGIRDLTLPDWKKLPEWKLFEQALTKLDAIQTRQKTPNILREETSEWDTTMNDAEVTCHHRMIDGVLCRWWGDGPTPKGVGAIDKAAAFVTAESKHTKEMSGKDKDILDQALRDSVTTVESGQCDHPSCDQKGICNECGEPVPNPDDYSSGG